MRPQEVEGLQQKLAKALKPDHSAGHEGNVRDGQKAPMRERRHLVLGARLEVLRSTVLFLKVLVTGVPV